MLTLTYLVQIINVTCRSFAPLPCVLISVLLGTTVTTDTEDPWIHISIIRLTVCIKWEFHTCVLYSVLCPYRDKKILMQDLRFSQRCCFATKSSGMWCCINEWVVLSISKALQYMKTSETIHPTTCNHFLKDISPQKILHAENGIKLNMVLTLQNTFGQILQQ